MRRAYDYWQDQPGCYPSDHTQQPPVQNTRQMTSSRIQRTGSRRFKPEGAQAETRSVFSTNVETRASRQVSRALRSGHDQIDASPVAFLLFSLGLPAQSDIRETQRGSTRPFTVAGTIAGSGSVQDQTLGAWRARSRHPQVSHNLPFSRRFFTSGTYVMRTA